MKEIKDIKIANFSEIKNLNMKFKIKNYFWYINIIKINSYNNIYAPCSSNKKQIYNMYKNLMKKNLIIYFIIKL